MNDLCGGCWVWDHIGGVTVISLYIIIEDFTSPFHLPFPLTPILVTTPCISSLPLSPCLSPPLHYTMYMYPCLHVLFCFFWFVNHWVWIVCYVVYWCDMLLSLHLQDGYTCTSLPSPPPLSIPSQSYVWTRTYTCTPNY